jgi:hypothetical protein
METRSYLGVRKADEPKSPTSAKRQALAPASVPWAMCMCPCCEQKLICYDVNTFHAHINSCEGPMRQRARNILAQDDGGLSTARSSIDSIRASIAVLGSSTSSELRETFAQLALTSAAHRAGERVSPQSVSAGVRALDVVFGCSFDTPTRDFSESEREQETLPFRRKEHELFVDPVLSSPPSGIAADQWQHFGDLEPLSPVELDIKPPKWEQEQHTPPSSAARPKFSDIAWEDTPYSDFKRSLHSEALRSERVF